VEPNPNAPVLTRPEYDCVVLNYSHNASYYTIPPLSELRAMTDDELMQVEGFEVGRKGYGKVHWPGMYSFTSVFAVLQLYNGYSMFES